MHTDNATSRNPRRGRGRHLPSAQPDLGETALAVPESDPERIAFNLWNEGRVDEAIQFLEREIASRKTRYEAPDEATTGRSTPDGAALPFTVPAEVEPVSDWRERHRSALAPAEFNAFGHSANTIDLVASPADAILPHPPRRPRAVWVMGLCLAVAGISGAAAFWSTRASGPGDMIVSAMQPKSANAPATVVPVTPVAALPKPASPKPADAVASVATDNSDIIVDDDPDNGPADTSADSVPPPEDEIPPPEDQSAAKDDAADQAGAPVTTGSTDSTSGVSDQPSASDQSTAPDQPAAEARLPRQRPEPPAAAASRRSPAAQSVTARADSTGQRLVYSPPPGQASGPAPVFDPANPPQTLTPAEYQALLERRAWAEDYVTRRRALAERRAAIQDGPIYLGDPGSFAPMQPD